ncbi:DNA-binding response regulator [Vibrio sp. HA2012]|uniref:response regulator transcription factor n=1 Tax=Vibrio sp. HA2012 TaxID=1971595 RepID=UPI000C2BD66B|nr:response regulator transcription factor [Vibrio sp. HA2012]PJC87264.1 DNA-binding response regulator [Vibrio sp. HA2012]
MNRILLLEDHDRLANLILQGLTAGGIMVDVFHKIDHAEKALLCIEYSVLVIDRGLPDGDGLEWVKRLRQHGNMVPCLMLTAKNSLHDRVDGLESGADDYLSKPFEMAELVARVKALLRRPVIAVVSSPACGDITLDPQTNTIICKDQCEILSNAEMQIMLLLVKKEGHIVRHGALEAAGWGLSEPVTPNALDVSLHRIRRKLKSLQSRMQVSNIRGVGYVLQDSITVNHQH